MKQYYHIMQSARNADIYIYGDITSWPWLENDVQSAPLVKEIDGLDVDVISVYINSYGGEVAEALAICSALERNKARIVTHCDGFGCSAAADIFMAGDERLMSDASLLFIHNVISGMWGDANALRKVADDLDTITEATKNLYKGKLKISDEKLREMMDVETWLTPERAVEMGFATGITKREQKTTASQSARAAVFQRMTAPPSALQVSVKDLDIIKDMQGMIDALRQQLAPPVTPPPSPPNNPKPNVQQLFLGLLK